MEALAREIEPAWETEDKRLVGLLSEARKFANLFNEADMLQMSKLRNLKGEPFRWAILRLMLSKNQEHQKRLLESWSRHAFTMREWQRQIRGIDRDGSQRGRAPQRPSTPDGALRQVEEMARRWTNWHQTGLGMNSKRERVQGGPPQPTLLERLPSSIRRQMETVLPIIKELLALAAGELRKSEVPERA